MIDLRSDTVTKPTPQMRQAMATAEVGDDVFGDDPTVLALEKRTADLLGKEAAVFMPSGTMTNQVALRAHTEPGDEILIDAGAHVYNYEGGAPAALSGVSCRLLPGVRGIFTAADVKAVLRPWNPHYPVTKLVCLENTHNRGGGSIWPLPQIAEVEAVARDAGLKMHLDGARLWNATAATGIPEREYAKHFDTVSVCFSKGLGAPVGSALAGPPDLIARARRFRKQFGGGMRQAGIIAAGALYALDHHRERLKEDHANARRFAEAVARIPGMELIFGLPETNLVFLRVKTMPAPELSHRLREKGVLINANSADTLRAVANLGVSREEMDEAAAAIRSILTG